MDRPLTRLLLLAALSPIAGNALTVFDVVGVGTVCPYSMTSSENCVNGVVATGTVSIHVNPAGTGGAYYETDGTSYAYSENWVTTTFDLTWAGGSFVSSLLPGAYSFSDYTEVYDNYLGSYDYLRQRSLSQFYDPQTTESSEKGGFLMRYTSDLSWLQGLSFPETLGLAPNAGAHGSNYLYVVDHGYKQNDGDPTDFHGYQGDFQLSQMKVRYTSVPEPVPLPAAAWLLLSGLGGLGLLARRRKAA